MMGYLKYYDLEKYLLGDVGERFRSSKELRPLDLFLILHWKAPRAKTKTKDMLIKNAGSFEKAASKIAASISTASTPEEKLKALMHECELRLPTATAILTILYPQEFTVYDKRVRDQLKFKSIREDYSDRHWNVIWNSYLEFKQSLVANAPPELCLRQKDRHFWAKDFFEQAERDWRKPPKLSEK